VDKGEGNVGCWGSTAWAGAGEVEAGLKVVLAG
jgi:hypothetical protein